MLCEIKGDNVAILWDSTTEPYDLPKGEWKVGENKATAEKYLTHEGSGESWLGAPNINELTRRLREGWPEGSDRLLKLATREIQPQSIRRRRERADQGAELDIHSVYRGDLSRAWTRTRRRSGNGVRNVAIISNLTDSANVSASDLFWRGAASLKLAEALMEAGYNVAIYGAESGQKACSAGRTRVCQFVEIKADDQPLDLDRLAALTAMPGYFRTALFAGIAKGCDMLDRTPSWGLGVPDPQFIEQAAKMLPAIPGNAIIQPPVNSKKAAEDWIDKVLDGLEHPTE
jgi:hypothetical protein